MVTKRVSSSKHVSKIIIPTRQRKVRSRERGHSSTSTSARKHLQTHLTGRRWERGRILFWKEETETSIAIGTCKLWPADRKNRQNVCEKSIARVLQGLLRHTKRVMRTFGGRCQDSWCLPPNYNSVSSGSAACCSHIQSSSC